MNNQRNILVTTSLFLLAACGQVEEAPTQNSAVSETATQTTQAEGMTAWGHPDLQGVYTFATNTPLERPLALGEKATYTPEELAEQEGNFHARRLLSGQTNTPGNVASYDTIWTDNETGQLLSRTSLIVDPANGRLPAVTENGQAILDAYSADMAARQYGEEPFVKTAYRTLFDLPAYERCVARPMPRVWQAYNHGTQILQTQDHVVIFYESMHDARIIPLDGRAPLPEEVRFWNGDSRGRWEDDTLVITSSNYAKQWMDGGRAGPPMQFPMDNMQVTERFRRLDDSTLNYEITVEDPTLWTQPWTMAMPWVSDDPNYALPEHLYEFACHEGNYRAMENTLRGSFDFFEQNQSGE